MTDSETGTIVREKPAQKVKLSPPKMFKVMLLNDDYTSMDFVVKVLEEIFSHSPSASVRIMLQVHNQGRGLAGIFSKQIAETKIDQVHKKARKVGFPLMCDLEEE